MAFAGNPRLIVLDEPTTALDVSTQRLVLNTVRELCAKHQVAAIYVSHDLAVVSELATRIAVMYSGRVIELGEAADVVGRPLHPYTRGLLTAVPSPTRALRLVGIEGTPPSPSRRPSGCAFAPRCGFATEVCLEAPPQPTRALGREVRCVHVEQVSTVPLADRASRADEVESDSPSVLGIRSLSAGYGSSPVLKDLTFDVQERVCTAIVGESGSGKTTLARAIAGLHRQYTGTISLGTEVLNASVHKRSVQQVSDIRYVFQNPYASLNPRRTVGDTIAGSLRTLSKLPARAIDSAVVQALEDVSLLPEMARRYPSELSGGERQRVAIARALVVRPRLLICDEVTSSLDASAQAIIIELLRTLQTERDLSILFITHNIALVRALASQCIVLSKGEIVEAGAVADVLGRPQHDYTVQLMHDVPMALDR
jgi:peptide/nickel transport system ATP-binding protein